MICIKKIPSTHERLVPHHRFPLYTGGKEREKLHFNYGVFLLNKNIAQMRWYCGIPTPDLRPTLANLHFLLAKLSQPRSV